MKSLIVIEDIITLILYYSELIYDEFWKELKGLIAYHKVMERRQNR